MTRAVFHQTEQQRKNTGKHICVSKIHLQKSVIKKSRQRCSKPARELFAREVNSFYSSLFFALFSKLINYTG